MLSGKRTAMRIAAQIPAPLLSALLREVPGAAAGAFAEDVAEYRSDLGAGPQLMRMFVNDTEADEREAYIQNSASVLLLLGTGQNSWPRSQIREFIRRNFPVDAGQADAFADRAWRAGETENVVKFVDSCKAVAFHSQASTPGELLIQLMTASRQLRALSDELLAPSVFTDANPIFNALDFLLSLGDAEWVAIAAQGANPSIQGISVWPQPMPRTAQEAESRVANPRISRVLLTFGSGNLQAAQKLLAAGVGVGTSTSFSWMRLVQEIGSAGVRHPWARAMSAAYMIDEDGSSMLARAAAAFTQAGEAITSQPRAVKGATAPLAAISLLKELRRVESQDDYLQTLGSVRVLRGAEKGGPLLERGGGFDNLSKFIGPAISLGAPLIGGLLGGPVGFGAGAGLATAYNRSQHSDTPRSSKTAFQPLFAMPPEASNPLMARAPMLSMRAAGFPAIEIGGLFGGKKKKRGKKRRDQDVATAELETELESLRAQLDERRTADERASSDTSRRDDMREVIEALQPMQQQAGPAAPPIILMQGDGQVQDDRDEELINVFDVRRA